jgi:hypothetical protein
LRAAEEQIYLIDAVQVAGYDALDLALAGLGGA